MRPIPLPFNASHEAYDSTQKDGYGNSKPGYKTPVDVPCFWWTPTTRELNSPVTGEARPQIDLILCVDADLVVGHLDRFTVDGKTVEVQGLPKNYDHGPFGFKVNRSIVETRYIG